MLISQGLPAVFATLAVAGWGLLIVALFHLVPLALDAASIRVMFDTAQVRSSLRDAILARWVGESANSFLPAGPIGGPVVMSRYLSQRGMSMRGCRRRDYGEHDAADARPDHLRPDGGGAARGACEPGLRACGPHAVDHCRQRLPGSVPDRGFYLMQRRGLFRQVDARGRRASRASATGRAITSQADAIDLAVQDAYGRGGRGGGQLRAEPRRLGDRHRRGLPDSAAAAVPR